MGSVTGFSFYMCRTLYNQLRLNSINVQHVRSFTQTTAPLKRICIVGAGPAGFYAAQYILKHLQDTQVDLIDQLPVPFGLVRYGVSPDHPEVKNVINTFNKTALHEHFRFLGNVSLGGDVTLQQLRNSYHAVLLTYGADRDRRMNIPNENQANVLSAREFVGWYNGLPAAKDLRPQLHNVHDVVIVGQGNVAIDVARMLLMPVDALRQTDITEYALETLSRSRVERVHLVGRRGPLQAAFSIKELRELLKLSNVDIKWRPRDFDGINTQLDQLPRPRKRLTELMLNSLSHQNTSKRAEATKKLFPIFQRAPKQLRVGEIEFSVTRLEDDTAVTTKESESLQADLILRSIGYQSTCVDVDISFDEHRSRVLHVNGRVCKFLTDSCFDGLEADIGLYVAGWLGTGPIGVILTTMSTAFAVSKIVCDDIVSGKVDTKTTKPELCLRGKRVVNWQAWQRIDYAELKAGKAVGKSREKIVDVEEMLKIAGV